MRRLTLAFILTCLSLAAVAGTAHADPAAAEAAVTGPTGEPVTPDDVRQARVHAALLVDLDGDGVPEYRPASADLDLGRFEPGAGMTGGVDLQFYDDGGSETQPMVTDPFGLSEIRRVYVAVSVESDADESTTDDQMAYAETPPL